MTALDVAVAIKIVKATQSDLKIPNKIVPYKFPAPDSSGNQTVGQYMGLTRTLRLSENYYKDELSDAKAKELLDTIIHEVLHANDSLIKQAIDEIFGHPEIGHEAARRNNERISQFLKERDPFYQREKGDCP